MESKLNMDGKTCLEHSFSENESNPMDIEATVERANSFDKNNSPIDMELTSKELTNKMAKIKSDIHRLFNKDCTHDTNHYEILDDLIDSDTEDEETSAHPPTTALRAEDVMKAFDKHVKSKDGPDVLKNRCLNSLRQTETLDDVCEYSDSNINSVLPNFHHETSTNTDEVENKPALDKRTKSKTLFVGKNSDINHTSANFGSNQFVACPDQHLKTINKDKLVHLCDTSAFNVHNNYKLTNDENTPNPTYDCQSSLDRNSTRRFDFQERYYDYNERSDNSLHKDDTVYGNNILDTELNVALKDNMPERNVLHDEESVCFESTSESHDLMEDSSRYTEDSSRYTGDNSRYAEDNSTFTEDISRCTEETSRHTGDNSGYMEDNSTYTEDNSTFMEHNSRYTDDNSRHTEDESTSSASTTKEEECIEGITTPACREKKKMKRTHYSKEDLQELNHYFQQNPWLSPEKQERLAARMGYTETQIKTWFQNKRASIYGCRRPKKRPLQELTDNNHFNPANHNALLHDQTRTFQGSPHLQNTYPFYDSSYHYRPKIRWETTNTTYISIRDQPSATIASPSLSSTSSSSSSLRPSSSSSNLVQIPEHEDFETNNSPTKGLYQTKASRYKDTNTMFPIMSPTPSPRTNRDKLTHSTKTQKGAEERKSTQNKGKLCSKRISFPSKSQMNVNYGERPVVKRELTEFETRSSNYHNKITDVNHLPPSIPNVFHTSDISRMIPQSSFTATNLHRFQTSIPPALPVPLPPTSLVPPYPHIAGNYPDTHPYYNPNICPFQAPIPYNHTNTAITPLQHKYPSYPFWHFSHPMYGNHFPRYPITHPLLNASSLPRWTERAESSAIQTNFDHENSAAVTDPRTLLSGVFKITSRHNEENSVTSNRYMHQTTESPATEVEEHNNKQTISKVLESNKNHAKHETRVHDNTLNTGRPQQVPEHIRELPKEINHFHFKLKPSKLQSPDGEYYHHVHHHIHHHKPYNNQQHDDEHNPQQNNTQPSIGSDQTNETFAAYMERFTAKLRRATSFTTRNLNLEQGPSTSSAPSHSSSNRLQHSSDIQLFESTPSKVQSPIRVTSTCSPAVRNKEDEEEEEVTVD